MDKDKILNKILEYFREEAPTVNVGSGNIAGTVEAGDDPPVRKRLRKRTYLSLGIGSRKRWQNK